MIGANAPYPNSLSEDGDTLWFCHSPMAADGKAMQAALEGQKPFQVFIVDKERNQTFDWGNGRVVDDSDSALGSNGRLHSRYTIVRVGSATSDLVRKKRARTNVEPKKAINGTVVQYRHVHTRSLLEARHLVFLDALGIKWRYEAVTMHFDDITQCYTCDLWLRDLRLWVEIKPTMPSDDEILKAQTLCIEMQQRVAIFYNECFHAPFASTRSSYCKNSVRSLLLEPDGDGCKWLWDCVWMMESDALVLKQRLDLNDTRWNHPALVDAYDKAQAFGSTPSA